MYEYEAVVVNVIDGDTVRLRADLGFSIHRDDIFRLDGINTPELNSFDPAKRLAAQKAKARLAELLAPHPWITVRTLKDRREKYGRYLAVLILPGGKSVNQIMLDEGLAEPYAGGAR